MKGDTTGFYIVGILPAVDVNEANDAPAQATPIDLSTGHFAQANLTLLPGDQDWFSLTLASTGGPSDFAEVVFHGLVIHIHRGRLYADIKPAGIQTGGIKTDRTLQAGKIAATKIVNSTKLRFFIRIIFISFVT